MLLSYVLAISKILAGFHVNMCNAFIDLVYFD
jgi:hypothetical protein